MKGYVATIGMFDGVHIGHQFVLRQVIEMARQRSLGAMAITFDRQQAPQLTPLAEKRMLLTQAGIDHVEVLVFDEALRQMTAYDFMHQVLKEQLNVKVLMTGYDNRFGHNRIEGFDDYVRYGKELGIEVKSLPPAPSQGNGCIASSSLIRQLIVNGNISKADELLGHPYTIVGCVEHGEHIGTRLGFPTANIVVDSQCQLIPSPGVYAVKVRLDDSVEQKNAMMNIGTRPTFDGHQMTLEVHVLRLHKDLYGHQLTVSFYDRLRDERRFNTIEELKVQLQNDVIQTEALLNQTITL